MFITCQKAAELMSEADHRALSTKERFQLWLHLRLCKCAICRNFADQLTHLKRAYRRLSVRQAQGLDEPETSGLSADAKSRIGKCLADTRHDPNPEA